METPQSIETRLWAYLDGFSSPEEKALVQQLLEQDAAWQAKYRELLSLQQLMQDSLELEEPSLRFTRNIMEEIGLQHVSRSAQSYINKKVIGGIAAFVGLLFLGFFIYGFAQVSWSGSGESSLPFNIPTFDLSKIEWQKFFNNTYATIFLIINGLLGLVLLDMYLRRKLSK